MMLYSPLFMYCEPLRKSLKNKELIRDFTIKREDEERSRAALYAEEHGVREEDVVYGLEQYLKKSAWRDDERGDVKIYVVKHIFRKGIVAYFGLKAGSVTVGTLNKEFRDKEKDFFASQNNMKPAPIVLPGLEISHLAVNDQFRKYWGDVQIGKYVFARFCMPAIRKITSFAGVRVIYIYAVGGAKLSKHYKTYGFGSVDENSDIVPLMPYYDAWCTFMYMYVR